MRQGTVKHKKDILFLCQFFYPEYISSATLPFDTALALKKAGFSVDALCGYPREYAEKEQVPLRETVDGIGIRRVKYIQTGRKNFLGRLINYFSFTFMIFLQLFRLADYRAVVVYSNPPILPWIASWAKALFGTKLIFVAYDLYPEIAVNTGTLGDSSIISRLMRYINKRVFRRADGVVALSEEMKTYILENRESPEEKVFVIPNWYEDRQNREVEENPFRDQVGDRFTVSYFGNMGTAQDMQTILDGMRLLKNDPGFCFLFAGHGNKSQWLRETIAREGIENAYFYEFLKGQDFRNALAVSDCALVSLERGLTGLCVPSKTYSYMMQGIPLLAIMDAGDITADIEAGAGRWVSNGEGALLAEHIRNMAADPALHSRMRDVCRRIYLEKYTTEICTAQYVSLMQTLLGDTK